MKTYRKEGLCQLYITKKIFPIEEKEQNNV